MALNVDGARRLLNVSPEVISDDLRLALVRYRLAQRADQGLAEAVTPNFWPPDGPAWN